MAKKRRIYQIAKELNISHEEILQFLDSQDVDVNSHMSPVSDPVYEKILNEFAKEKVIIDRYRKERERQKIEEERKRREQQEEEERKKEEEEQKLEEARSKIEEERRKQKEIEEENRRRMRESKKEEKELEKKRQAEEEARKQLEAEEAERKKQKDQKKTKAKPEEPAEAKEKAEEQEKKTKKRQKKKEKKTRTVEIADLENRISKHKKKSEKEKERIKKESKADKEVEEKVKKTLAQIDEKQGKKKRKKKQQEEEQVEEESNIIKVSEYISVDELAKQMDVDPSEVVAKCMELGLMVTINQRLDMDTIVMVADEFGFEVEQEKEYGEDLLKEEEEVVDENAVSRPPVVTVMGHVDHGKTTLLDYVRKTNVVAGESGGITQHIGAYAVKLDNDRKITFLDTPGHEAFTAMRARGAQSTDIVVLIVAADDAVMPQTVEAINHAKAAGVPIVVAINKIDKPQADVDRVKRELSDHEILVEEWGGKYQAAEISAKTGKGIDDLLESIILEADLLELKANPEKRARGVVIESNLDKGLGSVATVLVQSGTLRVGDDFICGIYSGRVRALHDERGNEVEEAGPAQPVRVLGLNDVPQAGDELIAVAEESEAKKIAAERQKQRREQEFRLTKLTTLDEISQQIKEGTVRELNAVIKGDADGSIEALSDALQALSTDEVAVNVVHRGIGMISEHDVLLASTSDAIIIGFHVSTGPQATAVAKQENVEIRNYKVIYNAVEEVKLALEGMLEPEEREKVLGELEVRDLFQVPRAGTVAGCYVTEGKITRDARARVLRKGEVIFDGEIESLKRFKDDVKEVAEGYECGVSLDGFDDVEIEDIIQPYEIVSVKRTLEQSASA